MVIRSVIITKNDKSGSNNLRAQENGFMNVHPFYRGVEFTISLLQKKFSLFWKKLKFNFMKLIYSYNQLEDLLIH
ncbi:MAG: hypothetical protein OQK29_09875, partial [Ignavibacteriaceae bacterium]|nr:hypothetical protein [Ignavibacteriaceae bacterium]